ncbi:MAG: hypothetical protein ACRYHQ_35840 [Janthinobacterium lividum]
MVTLLEDGRLLSDGDAAFVRRCLYQATLFREDFAHLFRLLAVADARSRSAFMEELQHPRQTLAQQILADALPREVTAEDRAALALVAAEVHLGADQVAAFIRAVSRVRALQGKDPLTVIEGGWRGAWP